MNPRSRRHYRPHAAHARAEARRPRPKPGKIGRNPQLRDFIPERPEMHVVHETAYQALSIQGRGELRRELAAALRTGRARRKPNRQGACRRPGFATPMVMISERPTEAEARAVAGHWEGDLIIGKDGGSRSARWSSAPPAM